MRFYDEVFLVGQSGSNNVTDTTFFTILDVASCYWFSYEPTTNTNFLSISNNLLPQQLCYKFFDLWHTWVAWSILDDN